MFTLLEKIARYSLSAEASADDFRYSMSRICAVFGLILNLCLAGAKLLAGYLAHSIALTGDGLNNLSDSVSSVVGIASVVWAGKKADAEHPFGHRRSEYLSSTFVGVLVLAVGLNFGRDAIERLLHPQALSLSLWTLLPLLVSILVKALMWFMYRRMSQRYNAPLFAATAVDSLADILASSVALLALLLAPWTSVPLDAIAGLICSAFIIFQGFQLVREALNALLGCQPDPKLREALEQMLNQAEGLLGWHDLIIHNYGPDKNYATAHVLVPAQACLVKVHEWVDHLERRVQLELGIQLLLQVDPKISYSGEEQLLADGLSSILRNYQPGLGLHALRIEEDRDHYDLIFDLAVPDKYPLNDKQLRDSLQKDILAWRQDVKAFITLDHHFDSSTEALDKEPPRLSDD